MATIAAIGLIINSILDAKLSIPYDIIVLIQIISKQIVMIIICK